MTIPVHDKVREQFRKTKAQIEVENKLCKQLGILSCALFNEPSEGFPVAEDSKPFSKADPTYPNSPPAPVKGNVMPPYHFGALSNPEPGNDAERMNSFKFYAAVHHCWVKIREHLANLRPYYESKSGKYDRMIQAYDRVWHFVERRCAERYSYDDWFMNGAAGLVIRGHIFQFVWLLEAKLGIRTDPDRSVYTNPTKLPSLIQDCVDMYYREKKIQEEALQPETQARVKAFLRVE